VIDPGKIWVRVGVPALLFVIAAAVTLAVIHRFRRNGGDANTPPKLASDKIPGLAEGELVNLPKLPNLKNDYVDLSSGKDKYLLLAFLSTECAGCGREQPFWKDITRELAEKNVAFYIVCLDADQPTVENFARAYEFTDLPVLFDPQRRALNAFKPRVEPQYVLFTPSGKVMGRWDGTRRYDPKQTKAIDKLDGFRERISVPLLVR
jgi:peroxiredoxin